MLDSGATLALTDSSLGSAPRDRRGAGDHADSEDPLAPLGIRWLATDRLQDVGIRWLATDRLQDVARGGATDNPEDPLLAVHIRLDRST